MGEGVPLPSISWQDVWVPAAKLGTKQRGLGEGSGMSEFGNAFNSFILCGNVIVL
jgi:hypothetical protein